MPYLFGSSIRQVVLLGRLCLSPLLACVGLAWLTTAASAGTLQPSADGTVFDSATGLTWTGSTCSGMSSTYTFDGLEKLLTGLES